MGTLLVSQRNYERHQTPAGHVERAARIDAVTAALAPERFPHLRRRNAPDGDLTLAELVHAPRYLEALAALRPAEGMVPIDSDTVISAGSLDAVGTALGGGLAGLDAVALGEVENAFCVSRPPGHHAERERPMGFCLVNVIAVVAREAQRKYGAERVAIVDFDVHHGNGTQDIFYEDASVFYASSHEMPLFPGTGAADETGAGNILNVPLDAGSGRAAMRAAYGEAILPAVEAFRPDFLLVSAGFDADWRDPLAHLRWQPDDFSWLTLKLRELADRRCGGRIVSLLEGGYDLDGLAEGVSAHVRALAD